MATLQKQTPLRLALVYAFLFGSMAVYFVAHLMNAPIGSVNIISFEWISSLNLAFAFRFDGLSLAFASMISGIGALIFIYASSYMRGKANSDRFFSLLCLFGLSMLGLVLADNIILLFIFWELTSITSYLLIGTKHELEYVRNNALQALLITAGGGLFMFAGLIWMGLEVGSFSLSDIIASPELVLTSSYITPILLLIIVGCFTKSAQWPFSFWLPNAMVAPTPVSAYLHSATLVQAGVYLLARLQPVLSFDEYWMPILAIAGGITALWSALQSLVQNDLKLMLAQTTLTALGTMVLLLAFPSSQTAVAFMVFMLTHALYKAALFMVVGVIEQQAGTRQISEVKNLNFSQPQLRFIVILTGLSMAGLPLSVGFIAKEAIYAAILEVEAYRWLLLGTLVISNALMVAVAYVFAKGLFKKKGENVATQHHDSSLFLWLPSAILAVLGIVFGVFPPVIDGTFVAAGASNVFGFATNHPLALWHGLNAPLALSLLTLSLGALFANNLVRVQHLNHRLTQLLPIRFEAIYNQKLQWLEQVALFVTQQLHNGSLSFYVRAMLAVISALIISMLVATQTLPPLMPTLPNNPNWIGVGLALLVVAGAFIAARANSKIMALAGLGASGFALACIFMLHGALDVAMTQLLVETLVVVLAAAVLWRVPDFSKTHSRSFQKSNILIAAAMGVAVYLALRSVLTQPLDLSISYFYENASLPMAYGRNIVNVILVDFRAFDTLGEITVIAIAALAVRVLMKKTSKLSQQPHAESSL